MFSLSEPRPWGYTAHSLYYPYLIVGFTRMLLDAEPTAILTFALFLLGICP